MADNPSKQTWHGIPREAIPWFPKVNAEICIGCTMWSVLPKNYTLPISEQRFKCMVYGRSRRHG